MVRIVGIQVQQHCGILLKSVRTLQNNYEGVIDLSIPKRKRMGRQGDKILKVEFKNRFFYNFLN